MKGSECRSLVAGAPDRLNAPALAPEPQALARGHQADGRVLGFPARFEIRQAGLRSPSDSPPLRSPREPLRGCGFAGRSADFCV